MSNALDALFRAGTGAEPTKLPANATTYTEPAAQPIGVCDLPIDALVDMEQPFKLYSEGDAETMRQSIAVHGVIQRLVVRPYGEGQYQIISGRNRRNGAKAAGLTSVPCEVRKLSDDEATEQMIETNLNQRPKILPSERAWAYRKLLEISKHQGRRTDLDESCGSEFQKSRDAVGSSDSMSGRQVQNYVSLTNLIPELLEAVDNDRLIMKAGVQLSYLCTENQLVVYDFFFTGGSASVSENLAAVIRAAGEKKTLTAESLLNLISSKTKPPRITNISFKPIKKLFPKGVTKSQAQATTAAALKFYFEHGQSVIDA